MNFFEHQDQARKKTGQLVFFFILAVVCLIVLTNLLVIGVLAYLGGVSPGDSSSVFSFFSLKTLATISGLVISIVIIASLFKFLQLAGGGRVVAEAMGGKLLNVSDLDHDERKTLNIVEEMAIASGTPVPPVYVIEEQGINAFAAGYKPADAVIGITRGCITQMDRDELQGVIAHEFSHILHGDMRLNIRLIGMLHGILVIGIIGSQILRGISRSGYRARSSKNKNALPFFALGGGLMLIGYAGTFFGNIIKAAVSRQREFLADASAVQFTRNPSGISQALQKIGGSAAGSEIEHPYASEISHLFFGQATQSFFRGLMATHPPLEERIKRVDPHWNGRYPKVEQTRGFDDVYTHKSVNVTDESSGRAAFLSGATMAGSATGATVGPATGLSVEKVQEELLVPMGNPSLGHKDFARHFLDTLPENIRQAAHEPYGARALVYSLLLDDEQSVRDQQIHSLRDNADPFVFSLMNDLIASLARYTNNEHRLPLVELCLPALKQLSTQQWLLFKENLILLMRFDGRIDLFEWAFYRIILHTLVPVKQRFRDRGELGSLRLASKAIGLVLSAVASSGVDDVKEAEAAFDMARDYLAMPRLKYSPRDQYSFKDLSRAVSVLNRLKPLLKPKLLKALCLSIAHDGVIKPVEIELIRALSACLDCPMPPVVLEQ
jgi:Zn-dependent protease with chaperone function